MTLLRGHTRQRDDLKELILTNKLPSTLIFAGASGIGKLLVARELACSLLCNENLSVLARNSDNSSKFLYGGCNTCKACHLFKVGNLPDFHFLQCKDKESSSISSIRELLYSLNLKPCSGFCRVILLDNVEHLSPQAANTLLKTLEEPRNDTFFILVTSSPSKLLSTLRSRCQIWFFDALSQEDMKHILLEDRKSIETQGLSVDELILVSEGSLENLSSLSQHVELSRSLREVLTQVEKGDVYQALQFASQHGKDKEALPFILQLLRVHARDMMRSVASRESQKRWAVFLSNVISAERLILERNLAPVNVIAYCLLQLASSESLKIFPWSNPEDGLLEKVAV